MKDLSNMPDEILNRLIDFQTCRILLQKRWDKLTYGERLGNAGKAIEANIRLFNSEIEKICRVKYAATRQ